MYYSKVWKKIAQKINFAERLGSCYTLRKAINTHKNKVKYIHPFNSFEIIREHTMDECVYFFNKYKYFFCYDAITFYIIIAALCGCIPIVLKIDGLNKKQWIEKTSIAEYCRVNGIYNLYGIAYGQEDIKYAEETIHLVREQWDDILQFCSNKTILPFIEDIQNFENVQNTILNNYYK